MRVIEEASLNYQTEHLKSEPDEYGKPNKKILDSYSQAHFKGAQFAIPLIANMIIEKLRSGKAYSELGRENQPSWCADWLEKELKREGIL